jgi:amino acid transporter
VWGPSASQEIRIASTETTIASDRDDHVKCLELWQVVASRSARSLSFPPLGPAVVMVEASDPPDGGADATVTVSAQLPELDQRALIALRQVGRDWATCMPPRAVWQRALPVDPHLDFAEPETSRVGRFVHIRNVRSETDDEELEATVGAGKSDSWSSRIAYVLRRVLIGPALRSTAIAEERMGRLLALAVLSPDALSSVAYGPEAMMAILVLAGSSALSLSLPIGAALAVLMLSVGLGYRQVIRAYPHGGGSYIVASDSLGPNWGLLAGAGLIVDYILTVAVSVASGVEAATSAVPSLGSATVVLGLIVIVLLVAGNLRGVRDAGAAFAAPTYLFVVAIALIVIAGLIKAGSHGFHPVPAAPHRATEALGVLLVLRAFASGATAMTGIEVISNAVPVFRPPEAAHARQTLGVMVGLLISMFAGVVLVAHFDGAAPGGGQTVLSQIAHRSVGGGALYAFVQVATTLVLLVAANSAFNGFPRLLYFMARDSFAPRVFLRMGDRLAFTTGIVVLAVPAAVIYAAFNGQTDPLIPLFAIGVFLAFTLAQSGMVAYWWRHREPGWPIRMMSTASRSSRSPSWTCPPCTPWRTRSRSASRCSPSTSAPPSRRPSGSSARGRPGVTTCRWRWSCPRIARLSRRWPTTSPRCTANAPT